MSDVTGIDLVTSNFQDAFSNFAEIATVAGHTLAYSLAALTLVISALMMVIQGDQLSKMFSKFNSKRCLLGVLIVDFFSRRRTLLKLEYHQFLGEFQQLWG